MNWFSSSKTTEYVNFEDVQKAIERPAEYYIVNTLPFHVQDCLIQTTLDASQEDRAINTMMNSLSVEDRKIIIYGKHSNDESVEQKAHQFMRLGMNDVFVYKGGMFEWLTLQDIYGEAHFPTTKQVLDILKYKPPRKFN